MLRRALDRHPLTRTTMDKFIRQLLDGAKNLLSARNGYRLGELHDLTTYGQGKQSHGRYLSELVGLTALFDALWNDPRLLIRFGNTVLS